MIYGEKRVFFSACLIVFLTHVISSYLLNYSSYSLVIVFQLSIPFFLTLPFTIALSSYLISSLSVCQSVRFHSCPTTSSLPLSASLVNLIVSIYDFGCLLSSLISNLDLLIYAIFYKRDDKLNILKYS